MGSLTLAELYQKNFPTIVDDVTLAVVKHAGGSYRQLQVDEFRPRAHLGMELFGRDLAEGTVQHFASFWLARAPERVKAGYGIDEMLQSIVLANEIVIGHLLPYYLNDLDSAKAMIQRVCEIADYAKLALFRVVVEAREAIIGAQLSAIQELSAPIIPIFGSVLVLPLIGAIDSQRSGMITATLLESINRRNATIVLLDITGVPIVDTEVAHHLLQAARAVRLLGAELVLVGIRPEIAQTIVQLGVDLSDIVTRGDLQAGFAYALERQGMRIVPLD